MSKLTRTLALACCAAALRAEVHTMSHAQAVERALQQNPEIAMARLDELRAQEAVRVRKDPSLRTSISAADWHTPTDFQ